MKEYKYLGYMIKFNGRQDAYVKKEEERERHCWNKYGKYEKICD